MEIEVKLYAQLRRVAGAKSLRLPAQPDQTVQNLLAQVIQICPGLQPELFDAQGEIHPHVRILLNGHDLQQHPHGHNARLQPEDTLSIFPAIGGG